jgi:pyruvate-formate lyase
LSELAQVLRDNYENHESLRNIAANLPCRYGNDCEESNAMMRELTDCFVGAITRKKNLYGEHFQAGLYTVDNHAIMGASTGALPNGRMKGVSLANGLSPCQGADVSGPTAVICSITKVNQKNLANGMVLDLKFSPSFLKKEKHRQGIRDMIRSYFAMGGMEVQFNVVSRETLLAAQKDPQKYRNLVVRVSGFSAYFVNLDKVLQDEIIARTEYSYE